MPDSVHAKIAEMAASVTKVPLVSVGIPTYMRPRLLERALRSLVRQRNVRLEIIIADNNPQDVDNEVIISQVHDGKHHLRYVRHPHNIGAVANLRYCLAVAHGQYFMWLADDDELIGEHHIATLTQTLDEDPHAVTAAAPWKLMVDSDKGHIQPHRDYAANHWLLRALKFAWRSDDDFFYGLHRTDAIRQAQWTKYWGYIRKDVANTAYPLLMDMVLAGKIVRSTDPKIAWVNHAYTDKLHSIASTGRSVDAKFVLRRLNVHALYAQRVYRKGGSVPLLALVAVSALSLSAEAIRIVGTYVKARLAPGRANP